MIAVVGMGVLEVAEGLAFGGFGWYEFLFSGGGAVVDVGLFAGSADVCPTFGVGDLDAFGLLGLFLSAGHVGGERETKVGVRMLLWNEDGEYRSLVLVEVLRSSHMEQGTCVSGLRTRAQE